MTTTPLIDKLCFGNNQYQDYTVHAVLIQKTMEGFINLTPKYKVWALRSQPNNIDNSSFNIPTFNGEEFSLLLEDLSSQLIPYFYV